MKTENRYKPFIETLRHGRSSRIPLWLMRQAGRYLPEYRVTRSQAGSFLTLCFQPSLAAEVTLQPLRRFDLDAAIIFSDILVIPIALGQDVCFQEGEGPVLESLSSIPRLYEESFIKRLEPVYEAISFVSAKLDDNVSLIGFAGAPWTLACYMIEGRGGTGFPRALDFMRRQPTAFGQLIDCLTDCIVLHLSRQIDAGAEAVQIFDSWAGSLEDQEITKWSIAPLLHITRELASRYPNLPVILFPRNVSQEHLLSLVENSCAAALSLDQNQDLEWAARALQPHVALQGNLAPDSLTQGGPELEREVDRILSCLSEGAHIFNLGHGILKETPPEHVTALVERVRRFTS